MLIVPLALFALLSIFYILVMIYDAKHYIIPNWLNLAILAAYPLMYFVGWPEPWWSGIAAFAVMLAFGMALFFIGIMGGGDVKLLAVSVLWTGWTEISLQFIIYTALAGGLLAIIVLVLRRLLVPLLFKGKELPRILMRGQPIPYGIAIAMAFLFLLFSGRIEGLSPLV